MEKLTATDKALLERLNATPITYTYAPDPRGGTHAKLVKFTAQPALRDRLNEMCMRGWVSKQVHGCEGRREPPETRVTYVVTALGRDAAGIHREVRKLQNVARHKTDAALLSEAMERE